MPLQNRVTPFGEVVALPGRGLLMGNRGVLHDDQRRLVRQAQVARWIACILEVSGRRRQLMRPRSYTELFFLDEATAYAAGHRPCAECRRADYRRFQELWTATRGGEARADAMDAVLQAERLAGRRQKRTYRTGTPLPNGTYVAVDGAACLVWNARLYAWSDSGYTHHGAYAPQPETEVLTPPSIVALFAAGLVPAVHPSAR